MVADPRPLDDVVHLYSVRHWLAVGPGGVATAGRTQRAERILLRSAAGNIWLGCHAGDDLHLDDVTAAGAPAWGHRLCHRICRAGAPADFRNRLWQGRRAMVFAWLWQLSAVGISETRFCHRCCLVAVGRPGNQRPAGQNLFACTDAGDRRVSGDRAGFRAGDPGPVQLGCDVFHRRGADSDPADTGRRHAFCGHGRL